MKKVFKKFEPSNSGVVYKEYTIFQDFNIMGEKITIESVNRTHKHYRNPTWSKEPLENLNNKVLEMHRKNKMFKRHRNYIIHVNGEKKTPSMYPDLYIALGIKNGR